MFVPPALQPHLPALRAAAQREPIGLYLHVPFCVDRCTYCSFVTTRDQSLQANTIAKLVADLTAWGEALGRPAVDTLYLGGGTPSLLSAGELERLTAAARKAFDLSPLVEATLEANPGTVDAGWLASARALGWDRISIGVQTLDDALLRRLGRIHDGATALCALELAAAAGFARRSADLMVGIPGQDLARVMDDARALAGTEIEHLSIYLLDLDKACPLKADVDAGRLAPPAEEDVAQIFEALQKALPSFGLPGYEISNYARPGAHSRHNLRYWERRPYLGLGPSAASQLGALRWTESGVLQAWLDHRGALDLTELDAAEALAEIPLLGLRLHQGLDWAALRTRASRENLLPLADAWEAALRRFAERGLAVFDADRVRLTERGMLLSNGVLQMFV